MFFPDPWPKKAQKKNRTATRDWLQAMLPLLQQDGTFHLKTDHREYFDFIIENLQALSERIQITELNTHLHQHHPAPHTLTIPEVTLFERLFIKDGLPIHSVKISPKAPGAKNV